MKFIKWATKFITLLMKKLFKVVVILVVIVSVLLFILSRDGDDARTSPGVEKSSSAVFVTLSCQDCADAGMKINVWENAGTNRGSVAFSVGHLSQVRYQSEKVADDGRIWYKVSSGGRNGWIPRDFVSR